MLIKFKFFIYSKIWRIRELQEHISKIPKKRESKYVIFAKTALMILIIKTGNS